MMVTLIAVATEDVYLPLSLPVADIAPQKAMASILAQKCTIV
jgi:hypothetical protein